MARIFFSIAFAHLAFIVALFSFASAQGHEGHSHKEGHDHTRQQKKAAEAVHADHEHEEHRENTVELSLEKAERAGVTISNVGEVRLQNMLKLFGETALDSDNIIHVVPRFSGTIEKVGKHLGEPVHRGDLLATIQSNKSLAPYSIKSEIDGVVIRKDATQGEFVNQESEIFVIANLERIWVNVAVFPKDLKQIRLGTPARVVSEASEINQVGEINYIRPTLTEATRTALARIELTNKPLRWLPGMFVEVEALLDAETVPIGVPSSSLILIENKMSVFILSKTDRGESAFGIRNVEVGKSDGYSAEIIAGLKPGDRVASGRTFILKAELGKGEAEHEH